MTFFDAIDFVLKNNSIPRLFHIAICDMAQRHMTQIIQHVLD